jgi:peroxiredoxin
MMTRTLATVLLGLSMILGLNLQAQYSVGDEATTFSLLNVDGNKVSPADFEEAEGFIVVFTCNHCPYSKLYEDRINALDAEFASQGYPVLAINPNDEEAYPEDSYRKMKQRAKEKGFTFPYLRDKTQAIARAYGASRTPHTYVLQREGDKLIVRYIGAIDDNPKDADGVSVNYVGEAIKALKSGKEVETASTKAIGCSIKWKKS